MQIQADFIARQLGFFAPIIGLIVCFLLNAALHAFFCFIAPLPLINDIWLRKQLY